MGHVDRSLRFLEACSPPPRRQSPSPWLLGPGAQCMVSTESAPGPPDPSGLNESFTFGTKVRIEQLTLGAKFKE